MLLSEAIRLGSMLGPQLFGTEFGPDGGSCALGAAALAVGFVPHSPKLESAELEAMFPGLDRKITWDGRYVIYVIVHMNDYWKLSRQRIADWIVANGYDCESVPMLSAAKFNESKEEVIACC